MNLASVAPDWLLWVALALLILAAAEDVWRLRISNALSAGVLLTGLTAAIGWGLSPALWQNLIVFAAVLVIGTALFSAGLFGGGDVKLFAAIALWFSLKGALMLVAAIFIAGGVVALLAIVGRMIVRRLRNKIGGTEAAKTRRSRQIPYGVAIAAGAAFSLLQVTQQQSTRDKIFSAGPDGSKPASRSATALSPSD